MVGVDGVVIAETESVCPECLARIPAQRVAYGSEVRLVKTCRAHGEFSTVVWRGAPALDTWTRPKAPSYPDTPFTAVGRGCPYDCGLCPDHRQHSCCVLLEVTSRCDLRCAVCFANAGGHAPPDPDLSTIEMWYRRLLDAGGPYNIQLSGGEPTQRDDLPEIIALGRSLGFTFFQVNTNGLRIGRDPVYLRRLRDAGLTTVFMQFDGTRDEIHRTLRGRALAAQKEAAILRCAEQGVGVVLVPVLVPGVNTHDIGAIIEYALRFAPAVRGVHFQPVSYFGRYPDTPGDCARITIPEVISAIAVQTHGAIRVESFCPPGSENAMCSFHANFVIMPDGQLAPMTSHKSTQSCCGAPPPAKEGAARARDYVALHWAAPAAESSTKGQSCCAPAGVVHSDHVQELELAACCGPDDGQCCCEPTSAALPDHVQVLSLDACDCAADAAKGCCAVEDEAEYASVSFQPSMGAWDTFLQRAKTHTFYISGMAFQDAWTLDLERLRECCIHVVNPEGKLIPFCAYNLTARNGCSLYRPGAVQSNMTAAAAAHG